MKFSISQFKRWLYIALDVLFPRGPLVEMIENMSVEDALKVTPLCSTDALPEYAQAIFIYRHPLMRKMIWELKYRGNKKVAALFAHIIVHLYSQKNNARVRTADTRLLLIPIPLTPERRRERGFNQNELIIEQIVAQDRGTHFLHSFDALTKIRHTAPQSSLKNRTDRLKNLSGCFAVAAPEKICGRHVVLIDDVMTTGATLAEARAVLLQAGALSVTTLALAH